MKDLDAVSLTLAQACTLLLDPSIADDDLRDYVFERVPRETLAEALKKLSALVRPPDDVFYNELQTRYRRVRLFLPTLLREVTFEAAPAGGPVVEAIEYLHPYEVSSTPENKPPATVVPKAWQRYGYGANETVDHRAYTFCVLDQLREALRRRDVWTAPGFPDTELRCMGRLERSNGEGIITTELQAGVQERRSS